jgi:protein phosphatase inhibitor 2
MSIRWDEAVIEEHDKLRGTRMKIDEPDTPYEHYTMADDAEGASLARPRVCPGAR